MHPDKYGEIMDSSNVARSTRRRVFGRLLALLTTLGLGLSAGQPANAVALPITKKCSTQVSSVSLRWYEVDSMAVTREYASGKWRFRVETSPKRTVTYTTSGGSTRYMRHHIDYVKMYDSRSIYTGKTVNYPGTVTYFYSSYSGMDFSMKAHITDPPFVEKFPTCRIYF